MPSSSCQTSQGKLSGNLPKPLQKFRRGGHGVFKGHNCVQNIRGVDFQHPGQIRLRSHSDHHFSSPAAFQVLFKRRLLHTKSPRPKAQRKKPGGCGSRRDNTATVKKGSTPAFVAFCFLPACHTPHLPLSRWFQDTISPLECQCARGYFTNNLPWETPLAPVDISLTFGYNILSYANKKRRNHHGCWQQRQYTRPK